MKKIDWIALATILLGVAVSVGATLTAEGGQVGWPWYVGWGLIVGGIGVRLVWPRC